MGTLRVNRPGIKDEKYRKIVISSVILDKEKRSQEESDFSSVEENIEE